MSNHVQGLGYAGLGASLYGYGTLVEINSTADKLFLDNTDQTIRKNAPAINPNTGDFVRDSSTGIHRGMDSVAQMVYLSLRTLKNSTFVPNFGIRRPPPVITDGIEREIELNVRDALSDLIIRNLVELVNVEVKRISGMNSIKIDIKWRNLTNNETNTFRISL